MPIQVNEIFFSIQGESTWSGLPCGFIRLTGCNLRCTYCDTQYAYEQGEMWSTKAILAHINDFKWRRVCITGGEPLLQDDTLTLIGHLLDHGYQVSLETNGSFDIGPVDKRCVIVLDIKCPSSRMSAHNRMENLKHLGPHDQLKFVISDQGDYQFAHNITQTAAQYIDGDRVLFSPAYGSLPADRLSQWMIKDKIEARLQIQLHKYLWPHRERGI